MELNLDQKKTLASSRTWWNSKEKYFIIDGAGGVGKTFLAEFIVKNLPNCHPVILAPTNEAVRQIQDKFKGNYIFKTIDSALGIVPTTHLEELKFEQMTLPPFWDNVNLAVIDEASMIDEMRLQILKDIGVRILFLGHKSQLPPVKVNRPIFDLCISPVFEENWKTSTLTIPQRNTGALWDFNNHLEQMIYTGDREIPGTYNTKKKDLDLYLHSTEGKEDLLTGKVKMILWTNKGVDEQNAVARHIIFGDKALTEKYLPGDKLILIKPLCAVAQLERYNEEAVKRLAFAKKAHYDSFFANTKAEVISSSKVIVTFNSQTYIDCYKVHVICEGVKTQLFIPLQEKDVEFIDNYYKRKAWNEKTMALKNKAFRERYFVLSLFAHVKHFYAATSYRMQGSTIDNVILYNSDISKCQNLVEQSKHRYVAGTRAKDNLMVYRG